MAKTQKTAATPSPQAINAMQRAMVLAQGVEMFQPIFTTVVATPANAPDVNVAPRNVGLIRGFFVEITATANNTDGAKTASISDFGLANVLKTVTFTDLNNNQRIQTSGLHLATVNTMKHRRPFASADVASSIVAQSLFGDNFAVLIKPATIGPGASSTIQTVYYVPLAYSHDDLRGSIYGNVVNASMMLTLTLNNNAFVDAGVDSTFAVYKGAPGNLTNVKVTVYQDYLDQLPVGKQGVVLPLLDLSTAYELKNTQFNKIAANAEFPVPYANFRDFISTLAIYNSDASADAGRHSGSDVNYWAMQSANFTNIFKLDPIAAAWFVRERLKADLPPGAYYFDHRRKPLATTQYGNMELVLNPISAAATAYLNVGWEDFAMMNTVTQAGSLAAAQ